MPKRNMNIPKIDNTGLNTVYRFNCPRCERELKLSIKDTLTEMKRYRSLTDQPKVEFDIFMECPACILYINVNVLFDDAGIVAGQDYDIAGQDCEVEVRKRQRKKSRC